MRAHFFARHSCTLPASPPPRAHTHPAPPPQLDRATYVAVVASVFESLGGAHAARLAALSRLALFADWPREELAFAAYWMSEVRVHEGDHVFVAGTFSDRVLFLLHGSVELTAEVVAGDASGGGGGAGTVVVLERAVAPCIVGDLPHAPGGSGVHRATAVAYGGGATLAALPATMFARLVLSPSASAVYDSARRFADAARSRAAWHAMRIEDAGAMAGVSYALMLPVQARVRAAGGGGGHCARARAVHARTRRAHSTA